MSRLIDRILDEFKDINYAYNDSSKYDTLKSMLNDAVEVVHGSWMRYGEHGEPNSIDTCIWQCDKCLETYYGRTERIPNYCSNCGAIMDGEVKSDGKD